MTTHIDESYRRGQKGACLGIVSNAILFAVKLAAGILGSSQAMIADAFHTGSDMLTSLGVLIGFRIASKPADDHHPFGHGRAESITAKLVSVVLILVGAGIAYDAARHILTGDIAQPGAIALGAGVLSVIVKEITYRRVLRLGMQINSTSLKADAYHHRSDVLSSFAAIAGIAGARMGFPLLDPLAGIIVGGFIIRMGAEMFHVAYDELMDAAPSEDMSREIEAVVARTDGVSEVRKIMARKAGLESYLEIIVGVDADKTVKEAHIVTMRIRREIFRNINGVKDVIVHVEPASVPEEGEPE